MKIARFVLKIVALSLTAAAAVCAKTKLQQKACASEYEDYEE